MAEQRRTPDLGGNTLTGFFYLVVSISSAAFITGQLTTARPPTLNQSSFDEGIPGVPARLWQDPRSPAFARLHAADSEEVRESWRAILRTLSPEDTEISEQSKKRIYRSLGEFTTHFAYPVQLANCKELTLMPVFIPGGPFAEEREKRIRSRYAVISGLIRSGFMPFDTDRLRALMWMPTTILLDTSQQADVDTETKIDIFVKNTSYLTFEWFGNREGNLVAVVWLPESRFVYPRNMGAEAPAIRPLQIFEDLASELIDSIIHRMVHIDQRTTMPKTHLGIIGPSSSGTLRLMVQELRERGPRTDFPLRERFDTRTMYSPWATVSARELCSSKLEVVSEKLPHTESRYSAELRTLFRRNSDIAIDRIGSDVELAGALVDELNLRGCDLYADDPKGRVVIVSELDSVYGRAFGEAFEQSTRLGGEKKYREDRPKIVINKSYLRGVDGRSPTAPEEAELESKNPTEMPARSKESNSGRGFLPGSDPSASTPKMNPEYPSGTDQRDYLRRLVSDLRLLKDRLGREGDRVAAIGLVGVDEFDKLLMLRVLRPEFGGTWFFTTDLDSVLLVDSEYEYTRNLIVASHFGLQLSEELQGPVPPLRSGYQAAVFAGVLRTLGVDGYRWNDRIWTKNSPRRFELARSGPYDFSERELRTQVSLHPIPRRPSFSFFYDNPLRGNLVLFTIFIGLFLASYAFVTYGILGAVTGTGDCPPWQKKYYSATRWIVFLFISSVVIILILAVIDSRSDSGEPFLLFEGISVWPTAIVRLILFFGAIYIVFLLQWKKLPLYRETTFRLYETFIEKSPMISLQEAWASPPAKVSFEDSAPYLPQREKITWRDDPDPEKMHWFIYLQALLKTLSVSYVFLRVPTTRELYDAYILRDRTMPRLVRVTFYAALYLTLYMVLLSLGASAYYNPTRGILSSLVSVSSQVVMTLSALFVCLWVFDVTMLCIAFIRTLNRRREFELRDKADVDHAVARVKLIGDETEKVGSFVYYSIIIILGAIAARSWYFDHWDWPFSVMFTVTLLLFTNMGSLWLLQREARQSRAAALRDISIAEIRTVHEEGADSDFVKHIRWAEDEIRSVSRGAFTRFSEDPLIRTLMITVGSIGGLFGFEYLL